LPEPLPPPPPVVRETPPPEAQRLVPDASAPPTPVPDFIQTVLNPPAPQPAYITDAAFLQRPSGRDFARYYPARALEREIGARVVLDCSVAASGRLNCAVASEDPAGWGVGEAALRASRHFRVAPATADGRPTSSGRLRVPMTWRTE
jgi:protein TonB